MKKQQNQQNCFVGIYLKVDSAAITVLDSRAANTQIAERFEVQVDTEQLEEGTGKYHQLAQLIAGGLSERNVGFAEASVALDCSMFMQHKIHSEFTEPRRIAQTVRFDTEDALATDISDVVLAFRILSSGEHGSELAVYTAQKDQLTDILQSLQSNGIDPVAIEPDVHCLSRFITLKRPEELSNRPFYVVLADERGHFIVPDAEQGDGCRYARTFLLGKDQSRAGFLNREIPVTMALLGEEKAVNKILIFDSKNEVKPEQLADRLSIEADQLSLAGNLQMPANLKGSSELVEWAVAFGAGLTHPGAAENVSFRRDFMPYQGKKRRIEKAVKFVSIAASVLLAALGVYGQMQLMPKRADLQKLNEKFSKTYSQAMMGRSLPEDPVRSLEHELRRIKNVKQGQLSITGEESVNAKLALILRAFNDSAEQTGLKIDSMSVGSRNIIISGRTSGRRQTIQLRNALEKSGLQVVKDSVELEGGRDNFRITLAPKG